MRAFRSIDRRGLLSDFIADPQTVYECYWPYRALRKMLFSKAEPLVSIVMATRNNAATIEAAIESLLQQSHKQLEIVVVDDDSIDETHAIVRKIQSRDVRVRYFRNNTHAGTGRSRNRGMQLARGAYLTFQDGDDTSHPSRIEMQLHKLLTDPRKKVTTCNYVRVTEHGTRLTLNEKRIMQCVISMMFPRREVLQRVGFFSDLSVSEDTEFLERIKIAFGPECHILVFRTLYLALFRPNSSFFSDVRWKQISPNEIIYDRDERQANQYEKIKNKLGRMRRGELSCYVGSGKSGTDLAISYRGDETYRAARQPIFKA